MIGFLIAEIAASASFVMEFNQQYSVPIKTNSMLSSKIANPSGVVTALSNGGTLTGTIGIGTPVQKFQVLIDTGSYIFWVQSSDCKTSTCTSNKSPGFNNKLSSSYSKVGGDQTLKYADGSSVFCAVNSDTLTIGSSVLQKQQVCEASQVTATNGAFDGVIGIGPPGNPKVGIADVFGTIMQSDTPSKEISFWYNLNDTWPVGTTTGEITFGGKDPSKYSGDVLMLPITSKRNHWALSLDFITFEDSSGTIYYPDNSQIIVDTGTTLVYLGSDAADSINAKLGAQLSSTPSGDAYTLQCSAIPATRAVSFFLGGSNTPLTLNAKQMFFPSPHSSGLCESIIRKSSQVNMVVIGALFLQNFYVVYDYEAASVGFATTIQSPGIDGVGLFTGPPRPKKLVNWKFVAIVSSICVLFLILLLFVMWKIPSIRLRMTNLFRKKSIDDIERSPTSIGKTKEIPEPTVSESIRAPSEVSSTLYSDSPHLIPQATTRMSHFNPLPQPTAALLVPTPDLMRPEVAAARSNYLFEPGERTTAEKQPLAAGVPQELHKIVSAEELKVNGEVDAQTDEKNDINKNEVLMDEHGATGHNANNSPVKFENDILLDNESIISHDESVEQVTAVVEEIESKAELILSPDPECQEKALIAQECQLLREGDINAPDELSNPDLQPSLTTEKFSETIFRKVVQELQDSSQFYTVARSPSPVEQAVDIAKKEVEEEGYTFPDSVTISRSGVQDDERVLPVPDQVFVSRKGKITSNHVSSLENVPAGEVSEEQEGNELDPPLEHKRSEIGINTLLRSYDDTPKRFSTVLKSFQEIGASYQPPSGINTLLRTYTGYSWNGESETGKSIEKIDNCEEIAPVDELCHEREVNDFENTFSENSESLGRSTFRRSHGPVFRRQNTLDRKHLSDFALLQLAQNVDFTTPFSSITTVSSLNQDQDDNIPSGSTNSSELSDEALRSMAIDRKEKYY